jgi:hypothetical protein
LEISESWESKDVAGEIDDYIKGCWRLHTYQAASASLANFLFFYFSVEGKN